MIELLMYQLRSGRCLWRERYDVLPTGDSNSSRALACVRAARCHRCATGHKCKMITVSDMTEKLQRMPRLLFWGRIAREHAIVPES
jgi:hypothetical protein